MRSRRLLAGLAVTTVALGSTLAVAPVTASAGDTASRSAATGAKQAYLVLADRGASRADAVRAIEAAGGTVVSANRAIGLYEVTSRTSGFVRATAVKGALLGAARNRSIGTLPGSLATGSVVAKAKKVEQENRGNDRTSTAAAATPGPTTGMDPLDDKLWGLRMVRSDRARAVNSGDKRVLVGVLDSGIDVRNPDLAGQVDLDRSRNFATDIPEIDGPCEFAGCKDPVGWDDSGHGTHVSGTIAAAANGFGVSGVAPNVTLVEIRGGQDSGFLFLKPVSDAITYAGDAGLDVINMSFYVDPWLYNCVGGAKEDSAQEAAEQQIVLETMNRAMDYAHGKGVTMVGSLGNNHEDISKPRTDTSSPDYPTTVAPHSRTIVNSTCFDMPVEGQHVIGVSALGPSETKADYSNYASDLASGEVEVSAPGGWFRDGFGTPAFRTNENLILSTYPVNALQASGQVDKNGRITKSGQANGVITACPTKKTPYTQCGYYAYLQGTSMASPHATGVAALAVSAWGSGTSAADFGLAPDTTRQILLASAQDHACPTPATRSYANEGRDPSFDATCVGTAAFNGFYGDGIVDAYAAVTTGAGG